MIPSTGLLKRTAEGARTVSVANTQDPAWQQRNLIEVVRLAAIELHADNTEFTWGALVKLSRRFHKNRSLSESLVASVLKEACVEVDLQTGLLRLAPPPVRAMAAAE